MPVRLVAGDRDVKFLALARRARPLLADGSLAVLAGGHALHLENPGGVARALEGLDAEPRG
jgi:pimeloyl-ACP methyl ester carboxylesterase